MISVYVTCSNMAEAKRIAKTLLSKKLIACANMFAVSSMFDWKGRISSEKEVAMLCKARRSNFAKIEAEIKSLHSYEVPCIVAFNWVVSSRDYANWVTQS